MGWVGEMLVDGLAGAIDKNGGQAVDAALGMSKDISDVMHTLADDMAEPIPVSMELAADASAMENQLKAAKASGEDMTLALAKAADGEAEPEKQTVYIVFNIAGVLESIAQFKDAAVTALQAMREELSEAMAHLTEGIGNIIPGDIAVDANLRGAMETVSASAPTVTGAGGLTLNLNISTFNNYTTEDIQQLTNEIMVTAGQFAKRKGVVFA